MGNIVAFKNQASGKPDWDSALRFAELLAGEPDPVMCWQVFDDTPAKRGDLAEYRHGRLSNIELRRWLTIKSKAGCGIFVCVNETDGLGRRRKNVKRVRAHWSDFDGDPLPKRWPVRPHVINESSPGRYQVFWFVEPYTDLNTASDTQVRLAAYFKTDPTITDPNRVCRVPGFDHQKRTPYRSHILEAPDSEFGDDVSRIDLVTITDAHQVDYSKPSPRDDKGRSNEPESGWDSEAATVRASEYLSIARPSIEGDGGNINAYNIACRLNDFGISREQTLELMTEDGGWNDRCEPPWSEQELKTIIRNATRYKINDAGSEAPRSAKDDFADDIDDPDEFEGKPRKEKPKSKSTSADQLQFRSFDSITTKEVKWLWTGRFAVGKLSLIAGFAEKGKSQIALSIASTVSNGGQWPNHEGKAEKGGVIILSSEDEAEDTIKPRLAAAGANMSLCFDLNSMVKTAEGNRVLNIYDDLELITRFINESRERGIIIRLVILDPINAYFGGKAKGDTHKTSDMRAILTPVAEWASRMAISVIGLSHFNKGGGGSATLLHRITDSQAITAVARATYFCLQELETGRLMFLHGKNNLHEKMEGIAYKVVGVDMPMPTEADPDHTMNVPRIEWGDSVDVTAEQMMLPPKRPSEALEDAQDFVEQFLEQGPRLQADVFKMGAKVGHSAITIRRAKKVLGIVSSKEPGVFNGHWSWALPSLADGIAGDEFEGDEFEGDHA